MNRAARRAGQREPNPDVCEHGNWKKTDGNGNPMCPHGCGFNAEPEDEAPKQTFREWLREQNATAQTVNYRGRGA